ncbi:MAG: SpoIVB peptidase [Clostridia bacterium]|nr:SpoIVB peptidase [Clostridia bacterium]
MNSKRKLLVLICVFTLIFTFYISPNIVFASQSLYVAGIPAGFTIKTSGIEVIGLSEIVTDEGKFSPSKDIDIRIGDIITKIGNEEIFDASSIAKILSLSKGEPIEITVVRKGEVINKFLTPKQDKDGKYKLGLFLREDLNGIGTITYFKENREFCALGHPIVNENQDSLNIHSGDAYECSIFGLTAGEKGKAGELKGIFLDDRKIGCLLKNTKTGIYGKANEEYDLSKFPKMEIGIAKMGKARILTCIDGIKPMEYAINIVKIDDNNKENKNFVIKIKDKQLLSITSGILQGMSGSPIIQNGKIVGAITHVFLNDPTRGFGISIQNMLEN